jgi:hypothetical protein
MDQGLSPRKQHVAVEGGWERVLIERSVQACYMTWGSRTFMEKRF